MVDLKRFQSTFFAGGRRLVQQQMHQPRRAQRTFQAAAGNIGAAVGVALKLMDLLGAVVTGNILGHGQAILHQRLVTHQFRVLQPILCKMAVSGPEVQQTAVVGAEHELLELPHQIVPEHVVKKQFHVEDFDAALVLGIDVFPFADLTAAANEQRRLRFQRQIKDLQVILLDHSVTPINSGLE